LKEYKANIFETILAIFTTFSIALLCFYFYDLLNTNSIQRDPFTTYNNNSGIIAISVASIICRSIFLACFLFLALTKLHDSKKVLVIYLVSALAIAFLQWFELYYGSTFYYGEVRDKQGLMFPFLGSLMVTLTVWKINYTKLLARNMRVKILLTVMLNIGLIIFWISVREPWKLWQS
jgi:hypothetical protein